MIAMILFCTHGTVLAQTQVSYDEFCKPTVTGHPNGGDGQKRWQTNGEIVSNTNLVADSPLSFSPIGSLTAQSWSNTNNEIKAYPGATFNLKITYGIEDNNDGWGTITIFQLRSDQPDNKNMLGQYLGDWGVQDGDNPYNSILNQKEDSNGFIVDVIPTERNATFKIDIPDNITPGELTVVRFISCKKYDSPRMGTAIGSCTNKYDEDPCSTNAIELNYCDYIIRIVEPENISKTVTVNSNGNGSARIISPEGASNNSITTDQAVTVQAFPENGYKFVNWTDQDNNIISTSNPYIHYEAGVITLTANFEEGKYPEMKRFFHGAENNQHNRYLDKVTYTINGSENIVFEATTKEQLPYTPMPSPHGTATTVGALIDKTATKIVLPQGTTSFDMKFRTYNSNITEGATTCKPEIVWTKQAYYIDFNNDFNFAGATDGVNEISGAVGNPSSENKFGDNKGSIANGWTRTITIPESLQPGTYRMRVVYYESSSSSDDTWTTNLFTTLNGEIRSGISYDFDIVIQSLETTRIVTVNANPAEGGSVKITSPEDITGSKVETSEPVTVVAEANPGYRFINWTNGEGTVSTNPEYTYKGMNGVTLTANFSKIVNRYVQTISPSTLNGASGLTRVEISDKILGTYSGNGEAYDNRGNQLSVCAWVNYSGINGRTKQSNAIISHSQKNFIGSGYGPSFSLFIKEAGKMQLYSRVKDSANHFPYDYEIGTATDIPQGWFHLVLTAKVENNKVVYNVYINGERSEKLSGETGNNNTFNGLPYLMDDNDCLFAFGGDMNCKFDDIMIWNTAIDDATVKNTMKGFTDEDLNSQAGLLAYYTFDDLEGTNNESGNLITTNSSYKAKLLTLTGTLNDQYITASAKNTPSPLNDYIKNSERQTPRGGEKFYLNNKEITAENWEKNGDENFGYLVKSSELTRLAYNGANKVALDDDVLAVYHNGNPALPTFVKNSDIITNDDLAVSQVQYSYVAAGLEYTMTMPSVAKTEWMPISLPVDVDLVSDGTYILRPGYNFWYAQVKDDYTSIGSENGIWKTVTSDTKDYVLKPGIISVPDARTGQSFTFYTKLDVPVVIRSFNSEFNKTLMPTPGTIKYIRNPYSFQANSLNMAGIYPEKQQTNKAITVYRFNKATGNFDPLEQVNGNAKAILNAFEPFFVHDSNNGVSQAPRYIGTKDVSGIVEFEAVYDVNVRGTENAVEVETFQNTGVQIYTLDGVMVAADEVEGTREFELPAGIYVVKTTVEGENKSFKVVVE